MKRMYFSFLIATLHAMTTQLEAMKFSDPNLPPLKQKPSGEYLYLYTKAVEKGDLGTAHTLAMKHKDYGRATLTKLAKVLITPQNTTKITQDLLKRTRHITEAKPNKKKNK